MLRNISVLVIAVLFAGSLLFGQGPYSGNNQAANVYAALEDTATAIRHDIDSLISRIDSVVALAADSLLVWDYMLTIQSRYVNDSTLTWIELTEIKTSLDSIADILSVLYPMVYSNNADIDSIVTGIDSMNIKQNIISDDVDSLKLASAVEDGALRDSIRDVAANSGGSGGGTATAWIDTTQYDFLLVDDSDTTNYEFIRNFSGTFVVSGNSSDSTQGQTMLSLWKAGQRLNKDPVIIGVLMDTLWCTQTTSLDTVLSKHFIHIAIDPQLPVRPIIYNELEYNGGGDAVSFNADSSVTGMSGVSGVFEFRGVGFSSTTHPTTRLSNGGGQWATRWNNACFKIFDGYIRGQWGFFGQVYADYNHRDSVNIIEKCRLDTLSAFYISSGGVVTQLSLNNGSIGYIDLYGAEIVDISNNPSLQIHRIDIGGGAGTAFGNISNNSFRQLTSASSILNNVERINVTANDFRGLSGTSAYMSLGNGSTFMGNTCILFGVSPTGGINYINGNYFFQSPVAIVGYGSATSVVADNVFSYCAKVADLTSGMHFHENKGMNNTVTATGTPADSVANRFY